MTKFPSGGKQYEKRHVLFSLFFEICVNFVFRIPYTVFRITYSVFRIPYIDENWSKIKRLEINKNQIKKENYINNYEDLWKYIEKY